MIAVMWRHTAVSYQELAIRIVRVASRLRGLGVRNGHRVGILAHNSLDWVVAAHAIPKVGGVLVPLHTRLTDADISRQAIRAGVRTILAGREFADRDFSNAQTVPIEELTSIETHASDTAISSQILPQPGPEGEHSILFTSGTTGDPKGVVLSWDSHLASARASAAALGVWRDSRWLASLPFFHIGGLNIIYRCALARACVVVPESFSPEDMNEAIDADGVTHASLVETSLRRLLDIRGWRPFPTTMRAIVAGGGPVSDDLISACPLVLPSYGLTESCSMATMVRLDARGIARHSAGTALPGMQIRIDTDSHIEIHGSAIMRGYLDDAEATRSAFNGEWLRTRDIGEIDKDGSLRVLARREDLIISGGENIYPCEIERALLSHPGISSAVVVGIADPIWGQVPLAAIVAQTGGADITGLDTFLAERLARYKFPRIMVVDSIPFLPGGKPDRLAIRTHYEQTGSSGL
jgi:o-succinylbenzoate---CoA ligase